MPDFSQLLNKPAGQAPKPKPLPIGNYAGIIKSWEVLAAPAGKDYQNIIRFHLGLTAWPDTAGEEEKVQALPDGSTRPIDLSKRQLRRDYYDSSLYRLDEFIRGCGVEPNNRPYSEVLPELVGTMVVVDVQQYLNERTNEMGNQVQNLAGAK